MTAGVREMLKFGANLAGFMTADFAAKSSDRVAIGYQAGARALGYYQNAVFIYENLLDVITNSLHTVAVASLSKMRGDLQELRRAWSKALSTMVFYTMPLFGILAVTSVDLVVLLLGPKWASAGFLLSILALRGIPHTVERTLGWLHVAAGRTERWMRWGIFAMCVQLVALFFGLPFCPIGVATAYVICMFILFIPALAYAGQPLGIGATDVIQVVWRQMAGSIAAAAVAFAIRYTLLASSYGFTRMALLTLAYVVVYYALVVGLFRLRMPIGVVLSLAQDFLPSAIARHVGTQRLIAWHYEHP
jgi:PST family polysaccharide transporter